MVYLHLFNNRVAIKELRLSAIELHKVSVSSERVSYCTYYSCSLVEVYSKAYYLFIY